MSRSIPRSRNYPSVYVIYQDRRNDGEEAGEAGEAGEEAGEAGEEAGEAGEEAGNIEIYI